MKTASALACAVIAICLGMTLLAPPVQSQQPAAQSNRLLALQVERRDTLRELHDVIASRYQQGQASIDELIRIRSTVLEAELPLAATKRERLILLEQQVDNFRELEEITQQRFEAGQTPSGPALSAKAARLAAEIDLEQERLSSD